MMGLRKRKGDDGNATQEKRNHSFTSGLHSCPAGCGSSHTGEGTGGNAPARTSQNADTDPSGKGSGDELLDNATLKGTVSDFRRGVSR